MFSAIKTFLIKIENLQHFIRNIFNKLKFIYLFVHFLKLISLN